MAKPEEQVPVAAARDADEAVSQATNAASESSVQAASEGKSKLRLAQGADGQPAGKGKGAKADRPRKAVAAGYGIPALKRADGGSFGLAAVNSAFVAVAVLMIVLTAFDLRANARALTEAGQPGSGQASAAGGAPAAPIVPDLGAVLAQFAKTPLFGAAAEPLPDPGGPSEPWQNAVRDFVKFMGVTPIQGGGFEAILIDSKTDKMHLLQVGQKFEMAGQVLTLDQLSKDEAVLTDGTAKQPVTAKQPKQPAQLGAAPGGS